MSQKLQCVQKEVGIHFYFQIVRRYSLWFTKRRKALPENARSTMNSLNLEETLKNESRSSVSSLKDPFSTMTLEYLFSKRLAMPTSKRP